MTSTIPVVMAATDDPVCLGLVQSLGHPGTNFMGLSNQSVETTGKRLELPKELVPAASVGAVMYALRLYVDAGGLVSHGANLSEIWRRAAVFVDKILKGARPGDLPVEPPTKFELVINLKSAKALGFTIPPSMLSRADDVVQ